MNVIILFSGGIDSTSLIPYYHDLGYQIELLFVNYGQLAFKHEWDSAKKISKHYRLELNKIDLSALGEFRGEVIYRNAFLITTAILYKQIEKGIFSIGIHSGTNYSDCSDIFLQAMNELSKVQSFNNLKLDAPFIEFKKDEIWEYAESKNVPLNLTYSCELGNKQPCNSCPSCKDLKKLYDT